MNLPCTTQHNRKATSLWSLPQTQASVCQPPSLEDVRIGCWARLFCPWGHGSNPRRVIAWRSQWRVDDGMTFCSILCPPINTIIWQHRLKRGQEPEWGKKEQHKKVTSAVENCCSKHGHGIIKGPGLLMSRDLLNSCDILEKLHSMCSVIKRSAKRRRTGRRTRHRRHGCSKRGGNVTAKSSP